jgi:hypothetical protein
MALVHFTSFDKDLFSMIDITLPRDLKISNYNPAKAGLKIKFYGDSEI